MEKSQFDVVTGALGFTGRYITRRLLSAGRSVKTLTDHPKRENPFGDQVAIVPFNFDRPDKLVESLQGASTLYNTYWIRFERGETTYKKAVENSRTLFVAAKNAGIRRLVHVSIINASADSRFDYFRTKAFVEEAVMDSGLSYAILRPTVLFGQEDILINNIAFLLRRAPMFAVFGSGKYHVQPVHVNDLAELAVDAAGADQNMIVDAVGPEIHTFDELVRLIARTVGSRARIIYISPQRASYFTKLIGRMVGDIVLTQDEIDGMVANLLVSDAPPKGHTRLSDWLARHADTVGRDYHSELERHYR
jgi:NADH dehydrogenase